MNKLFANKSPVILLPLFTGLLFIHLMVNFCGFYGNDDVKYASLAAGMFNGGYAAGTINDHFSFRWVAILATAVFYKLVGVTAVSSALFSFACFIVTAVGIQYFLKKEKAVVQLAVLALFFLNYTVIFYSHRLLPDAGIALFVFFAWLFYYRQRFGGYQPLVDAAGFSMSLSLAMLTKETIIITLPLWVYLFITDVYHKRNISFWKFAIAFFVAGLFLYMLYFRVVYNDWLYRYHLLVQTNLAYSDGTGVLSPAGVVKRVLYDLWKALLLNGDMQYLIPAIAAFIYRKSLWAETKHHAIATAFIILLVLADVMSFSFTGYAPLPPDPRHFMFLIPFAVICGGYMLVAFFNSPQRYPLLPMFFLLAAVIIWFLPVGNTRHIYLALAALFTARLLVKRMWPVLAFAGWVSIMLGNYLYDFVKPQYSFYFDQKKIVQTSFYNTVQPAVVYTGEPQTADMGNYFLGFNKKNVLFRCLRNGTGTGETGNATANYLLLNGGYNQGFKNSFDSLMGSKEFKDGFVIKMQHNGSALYEVKNIALLAGLQQFATGRYY
ncbi:ArnT family glycosyltransferase [Foetidibacter luteolus]|uniref:ArnT family glycosyltransferase n=1 Tax=Foetidibacter luteolus TaxID=2608880 RepID=UPI00129B955E|nr:hypothetical protein [Foetidibacter luteolus]